MLNLIPPFTAGLCAVSPFGNLNSPVESIFNSVVGWKTISPVDDSIMFDLKLIFSIIIHLRMNIKI